MTDFFKRLAEHTLGMSPVVHPMIPNRDRPDNKRGPDDVDDFWRDMSRLGDALEAKEVEPEALPSPQDPEDPDDPPPKGPGGTRPRTAEKKASSPPEAVPEAAVPTVDSGEPVQAKPAPGRSRIKTDTETPESVKGGEPPAPMDAGPPPGKQSTPGRKPGQTAASPLQRKRAAETISDEGPDVSKVIDDAGSEELSEHPYPAVGDTAPAVGPSGEETAQLASHGPVASDKAATAPVQRKVEPASARDSDDSERDAATAEDTSLPDPEMDGRDEPELSAGFSSVEPKPGPLDAPLQRKQTATGRATDEQTEAAGVSPPSEHPESLQTEPVADAEEITFHETETLEDVPLQLKPEHGAMDETEPESTAGIKKPESKSSNSDAAQNTREEASEPGKDKFSTPTMPDDHLAAHEGRQDAAPGQKGRGEVARDQGDATADSTLQQKAAFAEENVGAEPEPIGPGGEVATDSTVSPDASASEKAGRGEASPDKQSAVVPPPLQRKAVSSHETMEAGSEIKDSEREIVSDPTGSIDHSSVSERSRDTGALGDEALASTGSDEVTDHGDVKKADRKVASAHGLPVVPPPLQRQSVSPPEIPETEPEVAGGGDDAVPSRSVSPTSADSQESPLGAGAPEEETFAPPIPDDLVASREDRRVSGVSEQAGGRGEVSFDQGDVPSPVQRKAESPPGILEGESKDIHPDLSSGPTGPSDALKSPPDDDSPETFERKDRGEASRARDVSPISLPLQRKTDSAPEITDTESEGVEPVIGEESSRTGVVEASEVLESSQDAGVTGGDTLAPSEEYDQIDGSVVAPPLQRKADSSLEITEAGSEVVEPLRADDSSRTGSVEASEVLESPQDAGAPRGETLAPTVGDDQTDGAIVPPPLQRKADSSLEIAEAGAEVVEPLGADDSSRTGSVEASEVLESPRDAGVTGEEALAPTVGDDQTDGAIVPPPLQRKADSSLEIAEAGAEVVEPLGADDSSRIGAVEASKVLESPQDAGVTGEEALSSAEGDDQTDGAIVPPPLQRKTDSSFEITDAESEVSEFVRSEVSSRTGAVEASKVVKSPRDAGVTGEEALAPAVGDDQDDGAIVSPPLQRKGDSTSEIAEAELEVVEPVRSEESSQTGVVETLNVLESPQDAGAPREEALAPAVGDDQDDGAIVPPPLQRKADSSLEIAEAESEVVEPLGADDSSRTGSVEASKVLESPRDAGAPREEALAPAEGYDQVDGSIVPPPLQRKADSSFESAEAESEVVEPGRGEVPSRTGSVDASKVLESLQDAGVTGEEALTSDEGDDQTDGSIVPPPLQRKADSSFESAEAGAEVVERVGAEETSRTGVVETSNVLKSPQDAGAPREESLAPSEGDDRIDGAIVSPPLQRKADSSFEITEAGAEVVESLGADDSSRTGGVETSKVLESPRDAGAPREESLAASEGYDQIDGAIVSPPLQRKGDSTSEIAEAESKVVEPVRSEESSRTGGVETSKVLKSPQDAGAPRVVEPVRSEESSRTGGVETSKVLESPQDAGAPRVFEPVRGEGLSRAGGVETSEVLESPQDAGVTGEESLVPSEVRGEVSGRRPVNLPVQRKPVLDSETAEHGVIPNEIPEDHGEKSENTVTDESVADTDDSPLQRKTAAPAVADDVVIEAERPTVKDASSAEPPAEKSTPVDAVESLYEQQGPEFPAPLPLQKKTSQLFADSDATPASEKIPQSVQLEDTGTQMSSLKPHADATSDKEGIGAEADVSETESMEQPGDPRTLPIQRLPETESPSAAIGGEAPEAARLGSPPEIIEPTEEQTQDPTTVGREQSISAMGRPQPLQMKETGETQTIETLPENQDVIQGETVEGSSTRPAQADGKTRIEWEVDGKRPPARVEPDPDETSGPLPIQRKAQVPPIEDSPVDRPEYPEHSLETPGGLLNETLTDGYPPPLADEPPARRRPTSSAEQADRAQKVSFEPTDTTTYRSPEPSADETRPMPGFPSDVTQRKADATPGKPGTGINEAAPEGKTEEGRGVDAGPGDTPTTALDAAVGALQLPEFRVKERDVSEKPPSTPAIPPDPETLESARSPMQRKAARSSEESESAIYPPPLTPTTKETSPVKATEQTEQGMPAGDPEQPATRASASDQTGFEKGETRPAPKISDTMPAKADKGAKQGERPVPPITASPRQPVQAEMEPGHLSEPLESTPDRFPPPPVIKDTKPETTPVRRAPADLETVSSMPRSEDLAEETLPHVDRPAEKRQGDQLTGTSKTTRPSPAAPVQTKASEAAPIQRKAAPPASPQPAVELNLPGAPPPLEPTTDSPSATDLPAARIQPPVPDIAPAPPPIQAEERNAPPQPAAEPPPPTRTEQRETVPPPNVQSEPVPLEPAARQLESPPRGKPEAAPGEPEFFTPPDQPAAEEEPARFPPPEPREEPESPGFPQEALDEFVPPPQTPESAESGESTPGLIPFPMPGDADKTSRRRARDTGPTTLKINIGRIEVRPAKPRKPLGPYRRPGLPKPRMTLEDYLKRGSNE